MKLINSLWFFLSLVKMKISGAAIPLTVILNVTNRCNAKCRHCYAAYYQQDDCHQLSTEQLKGLISDLRDNGCLRISFSGGEPLLREDIAELIGYTVKQGMRATLNTNGILVSRNLEALKQLDALVISLDGRAQHHDILRGQGSGEMAIAAISQARAAGINLHINTVLNKYNLGDIDYVLDLAKKFKAKVEFNLIISNIFDKGQGAEEFKPANAQLQDALRYIIARKKQGAAILFSAEAFESVLRSWNDFSQEGLFDQPGTAKQPRCPAGKLFCLIDASGVLWACPHLIGKIKAENALFAGVARAWKVAAQHPCRGCYQVYHHEFAHLLGLKPAVIWNYFKVATRLN